MSWSVNKMKPRPWTHTTAGYDHTILDADNKIVLYDAGWETCSRLDNEDWEQITYAINNIERFKGALEDITTADETSTLERAVNIAKNALLGF